MFKIAVLVIALALGYLVWQSAPDIQRYLRMRDM
jgi:hypothetical protein